MKRYFVIMLVLVLAVSQAACGQLHADPTDGATTAPTPAPTVAPTMDPTTEVTEEPTTTPVTEPSTEPATEPATEPNEFANQPQMPEVNGERRLLTEAELGEFVTLFHYTGGSVWYNYALKCEYADPAVLNLLEFFYSAPMEDMTQEDLDFYGESVSAVHKYSIATMDEVLKNYFGIGFDQTNGIGLDQMVYNPDGGCYYHEHGDYSPSYHEIREGYINADGTMELYYISHNFGVEDVSMVVTLRYTDSADPAHWIILSNVRAQDSAA